MAAAALKDTSDNSAPPEKSSSSDEETKMSDSSPVKAKEDDSVETSLKIEGFGAANDTPAHLKEYADEGASPVNNMQVSRINKNAAEAAKRLSFSLTQCANSLSEKVQVPAPK